MYSTILTASQVAYLAGLPAPLPPVPRQVSGLVGWVDSADATATTYTTGAGAPTAWSSRVTAVADKAASGVSYTPPSAAAQPTYVSPLCPLYFDGTSTVISSSAFTPTWSGGSASILIAMFNTTGGAVAHRQPYSNVVWGSGGCYGQHMINLGSQAGRGLTIDYEACGEGFQSPAGLTIRGGPFSVDILALVATGATSSGQYWNMYVNGVQVTSWAANSANFGTADSRAGLTFGQVTFGSTPLMFQGARYSRPALFLPAAPGRATASTLPPPAAIARPRLRAFLREDVHPPTLPSIFCSHPPTHPGCLLEYIQYNTRISAADLASLTTYLTSKWVRRAAPRRTHRPTPGFAGFAAGEGWLGPCLTVNAALLPASG